MLLFLETVWISPEILSEPTLSKPICIKDCGNLPIINMPKNSPSVVGSCRFLYYLYVATYNIFEPSK